MNAINSLVKALVALTVAVFALTGIAFASNTNEYVDFLNQYGKTEFMSRVYVSGEYVNQNNQNLAVSTIQPIVCDSNLNDNLSVQASFESKNTTGNAGVVYRHYSDANNAILGANVFFDDQFASNTKTSSSQSQRLSAGVEAFVGPVEFHGNAYYGVSGQVKVADNQYQQVSNGYDATVMLDGSFVNAAWVQVGATYYNYEANKSYNGSANANQTGTIINANVQVTPQLQVSGNYDTANQTTSVGFQFSLLSAPKPAVLLADSQINKLAATNISYKSLNQVVRNNTIVSETFGNNTVPQNTGVKLVASNSKLKIYAYALPNQKAPEGLDLH